MALVSRQLLLACLAASVSLSLVSAVPTIRVEEQHSMDDFKKPWFYHDLEGPEFKVVDTTDLYEERVYPEGKWISTNVESILYSAATMTGFKRLYGYITGQNSANVTIPMTVPVKVKVSAGQGPFCKNSFRISFYVPKYKWDDIPKPKNPNVFIESTPEQTFYVSQYGGFAIDPVLVLKAKTFVAALEGAGLPVDNSTFWSAGYDPPFRLTSRHNEIWVEKTNSGSVKAEH